MYGVFKLIAEEAFKNAFCLFSPPLALKMEASSIDKYWFQTCACFRPRHFICGGFIDSGVLVPTRHAIRGRRIFIMAALASSPSPTQTSTYGIVVTSSYRPHTS